MVQKSLWKRFVTRLLRILIPESRSIERTVNADTTIDNLRCGAHLCLFESYLKKKFIIISNKAG